MAEQTQGPYDIPPHDPALDDPAVAAAYERGRKEALEQAERDRAATEAAAAQAAASKPPEPTHYLQLASGDVVDGTGAIPTHVSDEHGVVPVARAWER